MIETPAASTGLSHRLNVIEIASDPGSSTDEYTPQDSELFVSSPNPGFFPALSQDS